MRLVTPQDLGMADLIVAQRLVAIEAVRQTLERRVEQYALDREAIDFEELAALAVDALP